MRLTHWTQENSWRYDPNRRYQHTNTHDAGGHPDRCYGMKPSGMWLSDDTHHRGWGQWVKAEMPDTNYWAAGDVKVDASRLLVLQGRAASGLIDQLLEEQNGCWQWDTIAERYAGCLYYAGSDSALGARMPNYQLMWMSTWDCDSACIWDLSSVSV